MRTLTSYERRIYESLVTFKKVKVKIQKPPKDFIGW